MAVGAGERTAFVLGGGGVLGASEVGMLRALSDAGIRPDLVVGTSIGAINGVFLACDPVNAARRLAEVWSSEVVRTAFGGSFLTRLNTLARSGTHLHANAPLRRLIEEELPARDFADLAVPFQCVAACVERAAAHWFGDGPLVPAVLASAAVPGLLPPVQIGGEHFFDGGLVHSIPVGRAVQLGASRIYVLHVGRIEQPLRAPRRPWEVGLVAFEIARRHRFVEEMATLPAGVTAHVLPAGFAPADQHDPQNNGRDKRSAKGELSQWRYKDFGRVERQIDRAYEASARYLATVRNAAG
jgi:NTE family protein